MLKKIIDSMVSLISDLCTDDAVNALGEKLEQNHLADTVNEQMERYEKNVFPHLNEDEWFDLDKVNQYIKSYLFEKVTACFNLPELYQRECAKKNLIEAAYSASGADTANQKKAVYHYIQMFFQIIEACYLERIDGKDLFLAGKTVGEITSLIQEYIGKSENRIMDAVRYCNSFAEYIDGMKPPSDNNNAFHYRNELLKFRGRESELKMLNEFLEAEEALLWLAVTGDGGAGKSKLLYHFVKETDISLQWKSVWVHSENCEQFSRFPEWRYPYNLLFVIDYAGIAAADMGRWLERLERSNYRPNKMRFVFIEREGIEENLRTPLWFQNLVGSGEQARCVERLSYKKHNGTPFLELPPLERNQLEKVIENYAELNKKSLSDRQKAWILKKAEEIDNKRDSARVLIVLFTADAVLQGKEYKDWDIQYLISEIVDRYSRHWKEVLCCNNKTIFFALTEMLMFATAAGEWKIGDVLPEPFKSSSQTLCSMDADALEQMICEVNEEKKYEGKLKPLEPDLIGEYFVLNYWSKKRNDDDYLKRMFQVLWDSPWKFATFIDRCIQNYEKYRDTFPYLFQNGMEKLFPREKDEESVLVFAMLLVNLSSKQGEGEAKQSVSRLEGLSQRYEGDGEIGLAYGKGLFNLAFVQEEEGAKRSVGCLEGLSQRYEGNEEIALEYGKGLVNLITKQEEEGAKESVEHLGALSQKYEGNEEIVLTYGSGLVNLISNQEEGEAKESVSGLEALSRKYEGNEEIALTYGRGLFNLLCKQEEEGAKESASGLESLSQKYEGNEEIALLYGSGLFNLLCKQEEEGAKESVSRLEALNRGHEGNEEIGLLYGSGLFNLSNKQEEEEAKESVECLKALSQRYEGNEEIGLLYGKGLVNLIIKQEEEEARESVACLEVLSQRYEGNEEIALEYGKGLFNLSCVQEEEEAKESVSRLEGLSQKYEGNEEIALEYGKGLFNLSYDQEEEEARKSVSRLEALSQRYEGNEEIALLYGKGLFNLIIKQEEKEAKESVSRLKALSQKYTGNKEIETLYELVLDNLPAE